jgi:hypothetical protein
MTPKAARAAAAQRFIKDGCRLCRQAGGDARPTWDQLSVTINEALLQPKNREWKWGV